MKKGAVTQHRHNWQWAITKHAWQYTPNDPYSYGGFRGRRYWKCIRGNKVKHTKRMEGPELSIFGGILEEYVFIRASGIL